MSAYNGKTCAISFAIAPESASVAWDEWLVLGMMRTKSIKISWDSAKSTADGTAGSVQTSLATRCSATFSGDGVSFDEAIHHQRLLKMHFHNPGATTGHQPKVWFKLDFGADDSFTGPFLLTSWASNAPELGEQTWSIEAIGNGKTVYDDGLWKVWAKALDIAFTETLQ